MKGNDAVRAVPVAFATKRTGKKPVVVTNAGITRVTHRSFLQPITSAASYTVTKIPCNPGLSGSFPWVSKLARRYEEYRFTRLRYEVRSVVASSKSGVVMMSFDYDAADETPQTKAEQAQTVPNSETNVWMNNDLSVPMDNQWKYVRAGVLASNLDVKTYDAGNMWLSSAYGDNGVGGELYVEYTIEFRRPTDGPETSGQLASVTTSFGSPFNTVNKVGGVAFPFSVIDPNNLGVVSGGEFLLAFVASGTALTAFPATPTIASSSTTSVATSLFTITSATRSVNIIRVRVETGDVISFSNAGTGATLIDTRLWVAAADYATLFLA